MCPGSSPLSDSERPRVGLVAYDSLGDGLVYLMMAENLRRNGFDVTYFGGHAVELAEWVPQLAIEPYPETADLDRELGRFDLVLFCPPSFIRHRFTRNEMRRLAERHVVICYSRSFQDDWRVDHTERIREKVTPEKAGRLLGLAGCSGRIRGRRLSRESVVEITLSFMKERMGLREVTKDVELRPPADLEHRRYRRRIVIIPDSATPERKDWEPARFLDLAAKLKGRGLEPTIVVGPNNLGKWRKMPGNAYETPDLPSVASLAAYLYESGVVVGNDSGGGHLASFLHVPTVTIRRRMGRRFAWRPDWGPGTVVCPTLTLSFLKTHVWRPFVSTAMILRAVDRLGAVPHPELGRSLDHAADRW